MERERLSEGNAGMNFSELKNHFSMARKKPKEEEPKKKNPLFSSLSPFFNNPSGNGNLCQFRFLGLFSSAHATLQPLCLSAGWSFGRSVRCSRVYFMGGFSQ